NTHSLDKAFERARALDNAVARQVGLDRKLDPALILALASDLANDLANDLNQSLDHDLNRALGLDQYVELEPGSELENLHARTTGSALTRALTRVLRRKTPAAALPAEFAREFIDGTGVAKVCGLVSPDKLADKMND